MFNAIHVTHEAVYKVGGIGTVLEGLINSRPYRDAVGRTILVCPLFYPEQTQRFGPGGVTEYSGLDFVRDGPYAADFARIERDWGVRILYGRRPLEDEPSGRRMVCEVLLVDLRGIHRHRVNGVKWRLWHDYGLSSDPYEHVWEYEQYVQLAGPAAEALEAMRFGSPDAPAAVFAHEFMGVPTALALQSLFRGRYRSLFHAHEVAPMRRIVEGRAGHDVMFYNALRLARQGSLFVEQVFGPQRDYHKFAVVEAARHCDGILAVGDHVQDELLFMGPDFERTDLCVAYNGVPARKTTLEERQAGREHLKEYFDALLGWRPDLIFTHVTRMADSKAMWRDIDVLAALEPRLRDRGQTAILLVLSTELPRRPVHNILRMEQQWDWPLAHREGDPDLTGGEARYYQRVQAYNARARNTRILYVNQFGFDRASCGLRVPENLEFLDLRRGADVEFGLSLYEPFGISPLEPLTYGALCALSTSCGCAGFIKQLAGNRPTPNVILANYIDGVRRPRTVRDALMIESEDLREVELRMAEQIAEQILKRLPATDEEHARLVQSGYELAKKMSWDAVAERFVLPAIRRAAAHRPSLTIVA